MTNILYYSTVILNFSGVLFSLVYLLINLSKKLSEASDSAARSGSALRIVKVTKTLSLVFAFLTGLLATTSTTSKALELSATLYGLIAVSWIAVIAICGLVMLITLLSSKLKSVDISKATRLLFKSALWGAILALLLTWLFSA